MRVPDHAKRVFQGIIYSVYQWDQERFDGSHATYEMLSRTDSVMVIPVIDNKILVSREEQPGTGPFFSLFGGQIDPDEAPEQAVKRELLEESGYVSENWELHKAYEPMRKSNWKSYLYIARDCTKQAEQKPDPGEKIEIIEADFERFIEIVQSEEFRVKDFTLDVFRMEKAGKLEEFKRKILNS